MVTTKILALLSVAAVIAFASSAVVTTSYDVITQNKQGDDGTVTYETTVLDLYDSDYDDDDENGEIDGIPLKKLTNEEITDLVNSEDNILSSELDIIAARKAVKQRNDADFGYEKSAGGRKKRWVAIAARLLSAGRALFRGAARAPKPTVSGSRVTQQYVKPGTYTDAVKNFNNFKPDNVKSFTTRQGISGQTGTVGQHRFTVRDGSKQGSPTLEIRTPKGNGEFVRKFRFEQKK